MKKITIIFILVTALLVPSTGKAVSYRGFFDVGFTYVLKDGKNGLGLGVLSGLTTHGVQIVPKFFVGIGSGIYQPIGYGTIDDNGALIPLYGDVRFDSFGMFSSDKLVPFVDIKLGYFFSTAVSHLYTRYRKGFFLSPTIGVRFKLSSRCGFNLGLTCLLLSKEEFSYAEGYAYYYDKKGLNPSIGLTVGVDF